MLRVVAGGAAVDFRGDAAQEVGVGVAARGRHSREDAGAAGHHQRSGTGGDQHEPAASVAGGPRELLRQRAAPGDAEDVDAFVAEHVEQREHGAGQPGQPVGPGRNG